MKKLLAIMCLVTLLAGCGNAPAEPSCTTEPVQTTQPTQAAIDYRCPWELDVCAKAAENGTMDYYFMSSEGSITKDGSPAKWGDCCLIVFPDGQTMLIDSGVASFGPILVENLKRMGIKRLDHIVITHPHSDHQNGVFHADNLTGGVLDTFEVGNVYHRGDLSNENAAHLDNVCRERDISVQVLERGMTLQMGQVSARVLWPKVGTWEKEITGTGNFNNQSIVIRFDYGEHSSLFTGDLYDDGEMALMSAGETELLDVDLLKAPHHGGYTSASELFLQVVSAELAVATGFVGIRDDVAKRYSVTDTPLVNDLNYGYIYVTTDGTTMTYETSRQEPLPIGSAPID